MKALTANAVQYRVVRKIADGGMGSVYEMIQDGTDGPREVWREAGPALLHLPVDTPDVLLDVDTPDDLAALE
jgi:CTP:molybdopterin cytidylyltransferase MocA